MAYAAEHPARVRRLVLMSTLAAVPGGAEGAMEAAMLTKAGEPWYEDARAALEAEQAGEFDSDEVLATRRCASSRSTSHASGTPSGPTSRR